MVFFSHRSRTADLKRGASHLIEARCIFFMRVYDQASAKNRRHQAARTSGLFHMSPELIIKETTFKDSKNLNKDYGSYRNLLIKIDI